MLNKIIASAALSLALAGTALAQAPAPATQQAAPAAPATAAPAPATEAAKPAAPAAAATEAASVATADDCLKSAFEIAQKAEEKKLSNTELDKIEELLTTMEGHCDANQFKEAMVVHKDIKTMIDSKQ